MVVVYRRGLDGAAHEEDADALRGVHFVAGEGEEVDVAEVGGEVEGDFGGGLGGVGVEEDGGVGGLDDSGEVGDGEHDAGFVVGVHDGDEEGFAGAQGADEVGAGEVAVGVDGDDGDVIAAALEFAGGFEDGRVFDRRYIFQRRGGVKRSRSGNGKGSCFLRFD